MRLTMRMLPLLSFIIGVSFASAPAAAQVDVTRDPARVRLEVQDIRRLAGVMRSLRSGEARDTVALLERDYFAKASPGLRAYVIGAEVTPASLAAAIERNPASYADLDALADSILSREPAFRAAFVTLQEIFPGAAFPPVWFVIGPMGPAGLTRQEGALIAAERFADRPDDLVPIVLHELAHFQQAMLQGVDVYQRIFGAEGTLLALALREGSADLIAELTTGRHINPAAQRYGEHREQELWQRFRADMHRRETRDWMFVAPRDSGQPPDLGYWIGYRIARAYYERAADKRQAIVDILQLTDFPAFLAASGYGERLGR